MLSDTEEKVRALMFGRFIPALHHIFKSANPKAYERWQGNCCRQTAIIGNCILSNVLPEYEWTAWDGWFKEPMMGRVVKYNHAWNYGQGPSGNLLVDMARIHKERLFIKVGGNDYPRDNPEYEDMVELRREELPIAECLKQNEYYTGLAGSDLLTLVLGEMVGGRPRHGTIHYAVL